MREQRSSGPILAVILGGVAILFIVGLVLNMLRGSSGINYDAYPQGVDTTEGIGAIGYTIGDVDAPNTIVIYSDFACADCYNMKADIDKVIEGFVASGEARIVYKLMSLSNPPNSVLAAASAHCAGQQDEFWAMYNELWQMFARNGISLFKVENLEERAGNIDGLVVSAYQDCMRSTVTQNALSDTIREATLREIESAPAVFVNGERIRIGVGTYTAISQALDGE